MSYDLFIFQIHIMIHNIAIVYHIMDFDIFFGVLVVPEYCYRKVARFVFSENAVTLLFPIHHNNII